ncbi:hypothetical protein ACIBSW_22310 [Actinoplanes sp. NPDC049668]|uniref:hypothetical protein n=1 Tax=unclassified Actinoplanes TaxID=2626549 RepID=UPI0033AB0E9D
MRRTTTVAAAVLGLLLSSAATTAHAAPAAPAGPVTHSTQVRLGSKAGPAAPAGPRAAVSPALAPRVTNSFDGIVQNQGNSCGGQCRPSPSVASSGTQLAEVSNTFIQVHATTGAVLCGGGVTLNRFFRTTDQLFDPKIQFDAAARRFSMLVTVFPASSTAAPAMWVAASDSADACGTWRVYRLFFPGSITPGTWLTVPSLGQDPNALLISFRAQPVFTGAPVRYWLFGLPKPTVYAGGSVSFNTFEVAGDVAAATNAGFPMVTSPFSWFAGSIRGQGYRLYKLTNGGGPGAVLTAVPVPSVPWNPPTRGALQPPGGLGGLSLTAGEIVGGTWFDGRSVWFAHEIDNGGRPSVRYGAIDTVTGFARVGLVKRSTTSDDVNPSIGVGRGAAGPVVYLSWVFTEPAGDFPASLMTDGLSSGQPVTDLVGSGNLYLVGAVTSTGFLFGGYSATTIDVLRASNGGCAATVQQYFTTGGTWKTRIARIGACPAQ